MNEEHRQRTIDFILDQQAQFAANIQLLRETQTQLTISQGQSEARLDRIEEIVLRTVGVVERLADAQDRTDRAIAALADGQDRTERAIAALAEAQARADGRTGELQARTDASMRELAESQLRLAGGQEHTDERLKKLMNVVERYISKGTEGDSA